MTRTGESLFLCLLLAATAAACRHAVVPAPESAATAAPGPTAAAAPAEPSTQEINDGFEQRFAEQIAGREDQPAGEVFMNVQGLKDVPAGRLLRIMNRGYSRALGVTCTHCHVEEDFASDEKRPKRAAREMAAMHRTINEQLRSMSNLDPEWKDGAINCSTCHRGEINPMATER